MNKIETFKTLVLSTGHVSKATAQRFEAGHNKPETIDGYMTDWSSYGWVFYCHDNDETTPPELLQAAAFARARDCRYILFDCDGDLIDELPQFEW